jgi:hypothetical protein
MVKLIDSVYYEVGRIDELPSFPYPEIGVENDGILVRVILPWCQQEDM